MIFKSLLLDIKFFINVFTHCLVEYDNQEYMNHKLLKKLFDKFNRFLVSV